MGSRSSCERSPAGAATAPSTYHVKLDRLDQPKVAVIADLPIAGNTLQMETTRPAGIRTRRLRMARTGRQPSGPPRDGSAGDGDRCRKSGGNSRSTGRPKAEYDVDYSLLAARGWPGFGSGVADSNHHDRVPILFITTPRPAERITFNPDGWKAAICWSQFDSKASFPSKRPGNCQNIVVLTRPGWLR
jgi:hypothetical protein